MGTIEFRLLVLDSLKCSSKMESPINRSGKAVISRNLTTGWHNHLFSFFPFFIIFYFFFNFLFYFSYIYSCLIWQTLLTSEWCLLYLLSPPSKQKSSKLLYTIRSLLCGKLVCNVESQRLEQKFLFIVY